MAEYKVQNKNKKTGNARKIVGIIFIALSCIAFFFLLTNLVPAMKRFLMGTFGFLSYLLFIVMLLVGVALLNPRKYKLSKKYAIFLYLTLFFLVCIIQLAIVGDKSGNFGHYLASNYTRGNTLGGIIFGLFTTCILYMTNFVWAFVIFSVLFAVSLALFIDTIIRQRGKKEQNEQVKVAIKEVKKQEPKTTQEVNVVMSGNLEAKMSKEEDVKQKLGLTKRTLITPISEQKPQEPKKVDLKKLEGEELKKYLLTPPEVDINRYFSQEARSYAKNGITNTTFKNEMDRNIASLKEENLAPIISDTPKEVVSAEPEQLVSEADNIIREVMQESGIKPAPEKIEENFTSEPVEELTQPEIQENVEEDVVEESEIPLRSDRLTERTDRLTERTDRLTERTDRLSSRTDRMGDRLTDRTERMSERLAEKTENTDRSEYFNEPKTSTEPTKRFVNIEDISDYEEEEVEQIKPYVYTRPPIDLITTTSTDMSEMDDDIATKTTILENTLQEFGVPAKVQNVVIGPAVTRYELEMPSGITVKKILNLSSDIALALEANGGDVRIEAPVPGRNVVGIEVPNDKVATVSIKDILSSSEFNSAKSPLSFAVGKDITGRIMVGALNKMIHLLVAGTTGSGKSVMLNSIIISILYKSTPDDCKLLLIDPKQVEFTIYEGIPHLIIPKVISEIPKAINALQWALDEMERRFRILREARARDIEEYNHTADVLSFKKKKMPYIVIMIDEFSDFIMQGKKDVEDKIVRLAQKARACGIHLILATQHPTTDYVTGGIKANFPSRIAFKVASRVNSDVILGMTGAEKLLGKGDMLYAPQEYSSSPKRIQGCFITTPEIADIVNFVTLNNEPIFDKDIQDAINNMPKNSSNGDNGDRNAMDPLLPEALKMCIDSGQASTSMIQRRLSIGYPRAGKIIDQMTEMGYISAADGAKPRSVYISLEEFYQIFGDNYE